MKLEYSDYLVTKKDVYHIFHTLELRNIEVYNISHYQRAFTHKSYRGRENNERDEFLGDSLIALITNLYIFERFEDQNEGFLTKMKTKIVNGKSLAQLSIRLGLHHYLRVSKQVAEQSTERSIQSILEDTFEAFISAIFRDHKERFSSDCNDGIAFGKIQSFLVRVLERHVDFSNLVLIETNYKDTLLKHFQRMFKTAPIYKDIEMQGKKFIVSVYHVNGSEIARGIGDTKRDAQQDAAKHTLECLNLQ